MNALELLQSCAGSWRGTYRLFLDPAAAPDESESTLAIASALRGNFIHIDQSWACRGKSQEGSMLIGHDPESDRVSLHWIDTFHNGRKVMACAGEVEPGGRINVRGSYAAPPGPDWGWRIVIRQDAGGRIQIEMFNIDPDGKEAIAVRAEYVR